MTFIKELGTTDWWEFDAKNNLAINYYGACHTVDDKDQSMAEYQSADSWHDFYIKTNYCCLEQGFASSVWISPKGIAYPCEYHTTMAAALVDIIYGEKTKVSISDMFNDKFRLPDDFLISKGWIKIAANPIIFEYIKCGYYRNLTMAQKETLTKWCEKYHIDINDIV